MTRRETGHRRVPSLYINAEGGATRDEAKGDCFAAIAFCPPRRSRDYDADAEILTLNVGVTPASEPPKPSSLSMLLCAWVYRLACCGCIPTLP